MNFKRLFLRNKNNKFLYYLRAICRGLVPEGIVRKRLKLKVHRDWGDESAYLESRINYYNKLDGLVALSDAAIAIRNYTIPEKIRVYYFDSKEYLRFFDPNLKFELLPGDVIHIPKFPALVKSRPIIGENRNSVLLNLDKSRHFNFIQDDIPFAKKRNILVGRSGFSQVHRQKFFEMYATHPLCNLAKATKSSQKDFLSITNHLAFKFILALEGNDVASNLKWIMSSNSIAVMPEPTYETWFMEGRLIPDYHYLSILPDYSDLEEKLTYYIAHPEAAEAIARQANAYVEQFKNSKREDAISLLVLDKYFQSTNVERYSFPLLKHA
ncbi:glycosyl transferase family 90 [Sphingobacterium deserti]|uniref:Lipopolysaccharide-modifying protein n=1 Tax=Sphingobacterium deserti TaxID=1229276 RepID=A0A0B8T6U1_9SPHI|nr:glycosyl transferase family 90 [Sphingobacterium deserti]KGE13919.1 lipopolysaccharide-modifying protein [Sphingobacterium deserti]